MNSLRYIVRCVKKVNLCVFDVVLVPSSAAALERCITQTLCVQVIIIIHQALYFAFMTIKEKQVVTDNITTQLVVGDASAHPELGCV